MPHPLSQAASGLRPFRCFGAPPTCTASFPSDQRVPSNPPVYQSKDLWNKVILNFLYRSKIVFKCSPEVRQNILLCLDFMQLSLQVHDGFVQTECLLFRLIVCLFEIVK